MTPTTEHLQTLQLSLSRAEIYLANAKDAWDRHYRACQISIIKKEIAGEIKFLAKRGVHFEGASDKINQMTDDELLAELTA